MSEILLSVLLSISVSRDLPRSSGDVVITIRIHRDAPRREPSRERVQQWLDMHDTAPPVEWYPKGKDPWRNPTAKELEALEPPRDLIY